MDYFIDLIHQGGPGMFFLLGLTIIGLPLAALLAERLKEPDLAAQYAERFLARGGHRGATGDV